METGLDAHVLPELRVLSTLRDPLHRHKDVWAHTLAVIDNAIELEPTIGRPLFLAFYLVGGALANLILIVPAILGTAQNLGPILAATPTLTLLHQTVFVGVKDQISGRLSVSRQDFEF